MDEIEDTKVASNDDAAIQISYVRLAWTPLRSNDTADDAVRGEPCTEMRTSWHLGRYVPPNGRPNLMMAALGA